MNSTPEQLELVSTLQSALRDFAPGGARWESDPAASGRAHRGEAWSLLASQLGVTGFTIADELGGVGGDLSDAVLVMRELGRALVQVPFAASTVFAASVLTGAADAGVGNSLLRSIAAGTAVVTVADGPHTVTIADGLATGELGRVLSATEADVVLFASAGALWSADLHGRGAAIVTVAGIDPGWPVSQVSLSAALVQPVSTGADVDALLRRGRFATVLALSAEAVGVADAALRATLEFVAMRVQFGEPIGSFQAVQHACADMFVSVETAGALSRESAIAFGQSGVDEQALAATTFLYCTSVALAVTGSAIQLHGGIGFTWEHPAHRYFKRAAAIESMFTTPDEQRMVLQLALLEGTLS
ncbi:MAG: putative acyl-CoA dehydrogenase fadE25 [Microbacteriaceae bacterium]|nr:putative acyl-CoA dehydrogenase fadE25 [Microbacteriaceae bacterium]